MTFLELFFDAIIMIERHFYPTSAARRAACACAAATAALLTGCAGNLTGLVGAQEDFGCPASGGVNCTTVSATYEREHASEALASERRLTGAGPERQTTQGDVLEGDPRIRVTESTEPLPEGLKTTEAGAEPSAAFNPSRAPERVVMLWILPWVDAEGDLHSDSRVWMRVRDASWRIESVRTRAMQAAPKTTP